VVEEVAVKIRSALNMKRLLPIVASTLLAACAADSGTGTVTAQLPPPLPDSAQAARESINADDLLRHVKVLASDEYEGRLPATPGEEKTVAYLTGEFKRLGLAPGNPDGSYVQKVPLVGIEGTPSMTLKVGRNKLPLTFRDDYVAVTSRFVPEVKVKKSDVVFVGYGVQAPEYGWDDYKGLDVKGKTIVMLINDPAVPDAHDPSKLDDAMFKGRAMTYYGRWTYKYEIASKLGAAAAIIVHETVPASYPWSVVQASWTGEQFSLARPDRNASRVPVQAWITLDKARELFKASGQDFDALHAAAKSRDFKPVPLKATASFTIRNQVREVNSRNVMGRVAGSDPKLAAETIIYTAHWDHLGRDPALKGDQIHNGAVDNATGVAGLLELAEAFAKVTPAPKRSLLFVAVTAEEQGLLGSQQYTEAPLYPLDKTVAEFNMDGLNVIGPTSDLQVIGFGQNSLEELLADEAAANHRVIVPDTQTEKGYYYRSDQFNFAKVGVPALYIGGGEKVIGKPEGYGRQKHDAYVAHDYHQVSDEVRPDWDLSGGAQDVQLLFDVGLRVAQSPTWPQWKSGSEFKAIRDQALAPGH
jgi:Zn-dependent M28 family amino/carboxypeptidase